MQINIYLLVDLMHKDKAGSYDIVRLITAALCRRDMDP